MTDHYYPYHFYEFSKIYMRKILQNIVRSNYTLFFINNTFISNARLRLSKNQAKVKQHPETELLLSETYSLCSFTLSSKNDYRNYSNLTQII